MNNPTHSSSMCGDRMEGLIGGLWFLLNTNQLHKWHTAAVDKPAKCVAQEVWLLCKKKKKKKDFLCLWAIGMYRLSSQWKDIDHIHSPPEATMTQPQKDTLCSSFIPADSNKWTWRQQSPASPWLEHPLWSRPAKHITGPHPVCHDSSVPLCSSSMPTEKRQ